MSLATVWDNFSWRIGNVSPSSGTLTQRLRRVDPPRDEEDVVASRSFSVLWLGSDEDSDPTDMYSRWAEHNFELEVFYQSGVSGLRSSDLQKAMLADRHEILKVLRDPQYFNGYSDAESSTATGLCARVRTEDELDTENENVWIYRSTWRCLVKETEQ